MKLIKGKIKYLVALILMIIIGFSTLYLTALIPKESIYNNIIESTEILNKETDVFKESINYRKILIHNYTDAIMLNTIYSIDNNNILDSIIKCRRSYVPGVTKKVIPEKLGNLFGENGKYEMVREFTDTAYLNSDVSYEYSRYWHGYMTILRPLLVVFNVSQIRAFLELLLFILICILGYLIGKKTNKVIGFSIIISFIAMDLHAFNYNIQGVLVMILSAITSIFIAKGFINSKRLNLSLFIASAITAYLDFLTTPLISFLLPIITFFLINKEESINEILKTYILSGIAWGLGYLLFWMSKWIIVDVIYNSEIIKLSLEQIIFRIDAPVYGINDFKITYAIILNILFGANIITLLLIIVGIACISFNLNKLFKINKIPFVISMLMPIFWYAIFANHSFQHYFYTYRLLVISLISLLIIAFDKDKKSSQ